MPGNDLVFTENVSIGLKKFEAAASDLTPAMAAIAGELVTSTRFNFEREADPLGVPWKPVKNPPDFGTILRRRGDLFSSIKAAWGRDYAMAGPEKSGGAGIYGAVHQFGATIRSKAGKALNTPFGPRAAVTIPARRYLGWNDALRRDALAIVADHLQGRGKGGVPA